jgi:hypothetical protein
MTPEIAFRGKWSLRVADTPKMARPGDHFPVTREDTTCG